MKMQIIFTRPATGIFSGEEIIDRVVDTTVTSRSDLPEKTLDGRNIYLVAVSGGNYKPGNIFRRTMWERFKSGILKLKKGKTR